MVMIDTTPMRKGFTIIELLVVIAILAVLMGLVMAAVGMVSKSGKKSKSDTILGVVGAAVAKRAAETGGGGVFGLHPLANFSAYEADIAYDEDGDGTPDGTHHVSVRRSVFVRRDGGDAVARDGLGLRMDEGRDHEWSHSSTAMLLDSDVFMGVESESPAECDLPLLYGVPRERLYTFTPASGLSEYRRVAGADGQMGGSDDPRPHLFLNRDRFDLNDEGAYEAEADDYFAYVFGPYENELRQLGAVVAAVEDDEADTPLVCDNRIRVVESGATAVWRPGRIKLQRDGKDAWHLYRLRGKAIYDAWGREILAFSTERGNTYASAGEDGVFEIDPGADMIYQTDPMDDPSGAGDSDNDDVDGTVDNRVQGYW